MRRFKNEKGRTNDKEKRTGRTNENGVKMTGGLTKTVYN